MDAKAMAYYMGRNVECVDARTGAKYRSRITNVRQVYGTVQVQLEGTEVWFVPRERELREREAAQ